MGLEMIPDEGLLAEVAGLAEWPSVLIGTIENQFQRRDRFFLDVHCVVTAACAWRPLSPYARRRHSRRHALAIGKIDDGSVFQQQFCGGYVLRFGRPQQGRGADCEHAVQATICTGGAKRWK